MIITPGRENEDRVRERLKKIKTETWQGKHQIMAQSLHLYYWQITPLSWVDSIKLIQFSLPLKVLEPLTSWSLYWNLVFTSTSFVQRTLRIEAFSRPPPLWLSCFTLSGYSTCLKSQRKNSLTPHCLILPVFKMVPSIYCYAKLNYSLMRSPFNDNCSSFVQNTPYISFHGLEY